jgi:hypothetical protein
LNALTLCLQNGEHKFNFFAVGTKRTGTIHSSALALGICTDFDGPEDGWNMRHCCERIVASPQVGITELRRELSPKLLRWARVVGQKGSVSKLGGRTVAEDGLLEQKSKNNFEIYIMLVKCVGDKSWWTKRQKDQKRCQILALV